MRFSHSDWFSFRGEGQICDLHIYLTVPFVLSWSLFNALACGAVVLASDTAPVRELIQHRQNGLLAPFFDVDQFTQLALEVLRDPTAYSELGQHGGQLIEASYGLEQTLPQMLALYEDTMARTA